MVVAGPLLDRLAGSGERLEGRSRCRALDRVVLVEGDLAVVRESPGPGLAVAVVIWPVAVGVGQAGRVLGVG